MSDEKTTPEVVEETTEEVTEAPAEETKEEAAPAVEEAKEEAPAKEEVAAEPETNDVEVPKEFAKLVESVEKMTVLELNALIKVIEAKWGVSATAVAAAGPAAGGDDGEKSEFDVVLTSDGGAKIPVMKAVKELLGLGLKEAKELVEGVPATLKEAVKKEDAEEMKAKIEEAGGKVELK
ncbi:MAG: large subunit ribosomal protein L7/L12 [Candidatus Paceibacteria bacterium]|jgi:large subunit ribosomal protein L7/L12